MFQRGDIVEFDGILAVVVGTYADGLAPEDHVALWFGDPKGVRRSQGGSGQLTPEVWTVPSEYCQLALQPDVFH
jgi:hypothetical protein